MSERETAMNADNERTVIVYSLVLRFWRVAGQRQTVVETDEFHQTLEQLLVVLERVRPGTTTRVDLTTARIKYVLDNAKPIVRNERKEKRKGPWMLLVHMQAGPWIHRILSDKCPDLLEKNTVQQACVEAVRWYFKTLHPDDYCD